MLQHLLLGMMGPLGLAMGARLIRREVVNVPPITPGKASCQSVFDAMVLIPETERDVLCAARTSCR
jgi:hypothetical protein